MLYSYVFFVIQCYFSMMSGSLSFSGNSGNMESLSIGIGYHHYLEKNGRERDLKGDYYLERKSGEISKNKGAVKTRFVVPVQLEEEGESSGLDESGGLFEDSIVFLDVAVELDEFKSWDTRLSLFYGMGIRNVFEREDDSVVMRTKLLLGLGQVKEFGAEDDEMKNEMKVGGEAEWLVGEKNTLKISSYLFNNIIDVSDYRQVKLS